MTTRKSGLLGLALAVGILSACEGKTEVIVPPPDTTPEVTVNVQPNPVNLVLAPGTPNTQQMTATVSGAANTVTWSIAGTAATINATGLVTAAAVGQAVVTATSTVNPNIRGSATVIVAAAPPPAAPPTVVISTVTQGGTTQPVVTSNVMGQIDVVAVIDVPTGVPISSVTFDLLPGGVAAQAIPLTNCTQTFSGTGSTDLSANAAEPVQVVCSINTAEIAAPDSLGRARFINRTYSVRATINRPGGLTAISTTSQLLTFNNPDFIRIFSAIAGSRHLQTFASMFTRGCAVASQTPGPGNIAPGSPWCGGDMRMRFVPTIFSDTLNARPNTYTVTLTTSGLGSNGTAACSTISAAVPPTTGTPNCPSVQIVKSTTSDTLTFVTVSSNSTSANTLAPTNDITVVEDLISSIMVNSANTNSGLSGPVCINPDPATNPLVRFGGGTGFATPGCGNPPFGSPANIWAPVNPLAIDNLAPRVFEFDMTPARLLCTQAACFINGSFTFVERINFFRTVDYGVDGQTATFDVGTVAEFTAGSGVTTNITSGAGRAETQTPTLVVRGNTTDRLQNSRQVLAGTVASAPVATGATPTGAQLAAAQLFGIDRTPPVITSVSAPSLICATIANAAPCNSTDNDDSFANIITVFFVDTAGPTQGGPSGFTAQPLRVTTDTIYNAAGGATYTAVVTCPSATGGVNACDVALPEASSATNAGYAQLIFNVRDAAFPGTTGSAGTTLGTFNTSASREFIHLDDEHPPTVAGVTAPSTISGASAVTFTADATDNVELGDVLASFSYANDVTAFYAHSPRQTIGTYGFNPLDFSRTAATGNALSVTMNPFIYSLEFTSGAGAPLGNQAVASGVNFAVRDVAGVTHVINGFNPDGTPIGVYCPAPSQGDGSVSQAAPGLNTSNCIQRQNNNISPNVLAGTAAPASFTTIAPGITSFLQLAPVRSGNTVTLSAEARGPQGTFANPFPNGVNFYRYSAVEDRWIYVATAQGTAIDDDIQLVRRWVYTTNVTNVLVPGAVVRAIGINTGRGLRNGADQFVP